MGLKSRRVNLYKLINNELILVDYGVISKLGLYLQQGYTVTIKIEKSKYITINKENVSKNKITICGWCKRINHKDLNEYLSLNLHTLIALEKQDTITISYGICPNCQDKLEKEYHNTTIRR